MNEMRPANRRRRATIVAAVTLSLAAAAASWLAISPGARQLFDKGLAARRSNPTESERLFRRAIKAAGGTYPDAQIALCQMLAQRGNWDEALSIFATVDKPACRADLLVAFGSEALRTEHRPQGLAALEAASQRGSPASVAALHILRAEYHEAAQINAETAALYQLTRLEPDNPEHWQALVIALGGQRKLMECEAALREVLEQDLSDSYRREFEYLFVRLLIWKGDAVECRRRIQNLKKLEGQSFRISLTEVDLCRLEGRLEEAQKLAQALSPDTTNMYSVYYVRGTLHLELNEYQEAARDLARAVELKPFDENSHFKLSEACRLLKRAELADQHAKIAARISANRKRLDDLNLQRSKNPEDPAISRQLAGLHAELGDENTAQYWNERAKRQSRSSSP